jgi:glutamyl-tRNA reductase
VRIFVVGTSHAVADARTRERMHVDVDQAYDALARLCSEQSTVAEALPLHTCGRLELYGVSADPERATRILGHLAARHTGMARDELERHAYARSGTDAVRHLFRVSAGLDSVVHGEAQILGQVRGAARDPRAQATTGTVLQRLFQHALKTGKRVRSETEIGRGAASLASASIELLRREAGRLDDLTVLVVGAGDTGALMARLLAKAGVARITVANRTFERAREVADELGARAVDLSGLPDALPHADLVVGAASAPEPIVTVEAVRALPVDRRPRYFLDLAHPRCIEPGLAELPDVSLFDLEQVFRRVEAAREARAAHRPRADELVEEEVQLFQSWHRSRETASLVRAVRQRTLERALSEADKLAGAASDADRERMRRLARSVARAILHQPTVALRDADASSDQGRALLEHASTLFGVRDLGDDADEAS